MVKSEIASSGVMPRGYMGQESPKRDTGCREALCGPMTGAQEAWTAFYVAVEQEKAEEKSGP